MDKKYYQDEEFDELEDFEQEYEDEDEDETSEFEEERDEPKKHGGLMKVALVLVIIAAVAAGIVYGFRLEEVRVIGNKTYTAEEIKTLIGFPEDAGNTLCSFLRYARYKVEDIPFLEDVKIKIENRNMLCIEVDESSILGCIKKGKNYYYFDDNGRIQEVLTELQATVPLIDGVQVEELDQKIVMEDQTAYKGMMELTGLLSERNIQVQKIEIDEEGYFTVYINDDIRVGLGMPILLEEKTTEMANILPELESMRESEGIRGILHLENYDSTKNSIIFTKEN